VCQQEPLTRLFIEKGIFAKDKFMGMVKLVDQEMRSKPGRAGFADLIYLDDRTQAPLWGKRPSRPLVILNLKAQGFGILKKVDVHSHSLCGKYVHLRIIHKKSVFRADPLISENIPVELRVRFR